MKGVRLFIVCGVVLFSAACVETDFEDKKAALLGEAFERFYDRDYVLNVRELSLKDAFSRALNYDLNIQIATLEGEVSELESLVNRTLPYELNFSNQSASAFSTSLSHNLTFILNISSLPFFYLSHLEERSQALAKKSRMRLAVWKMVEELFVSYSFGSLSQRMLPMYRHLHEQIGDLLSDISDQSIFEDDAMKGLSTERALTRLRDQIMDRMTEFQKYALDLKSRVGFSDVVELRLEDVPHIVPVFKLQDVLVIDRLSLTGNEEMAQMFHSSAAARMSKYRDLVTNVPALQLSGSSVNLDSKTLIVDLLGTLTDLSVRATWNLFSIFKLSAGFKRDAAQSALDDKKLSNLMVQMLVKNRSFLLEYFKNIHEYSNKLHLNIISTKILLNQNVLYEERQLTKDEILRARFDYLESAFELESVYVNLWRGVVGLMRDMNISEFDDDLDDLFFAFLNFLEEELSVSYLNRGSNEGSELNLNALLSKEGQLLSDINLMWKEMGDLEQSVDPEDLLR